MSIKRETRYLFALTFLLGVGVLVQMGSITDESELLSRPTRTVDFDEHEDDQVV